MELFKSAIEKDPANAKAWNNQAWILLNGPTVDLERALQAVEKSLELAPDDFRFRETRGQIFVRLSRWEEAIEDLEFAANALPGSREIHQALASAYDALGNAELADVHRRRGE